MPRTSIRENARIFMRRDPDGKVVTDPYYWSYGKGTLTHWQRGTRSVFPYGDGFEASTYGYVYCRSLSAALAGTPWEYCPVVAFYEHYHEPMQLWPFLEAHLEHPKLEHLVKVGFYELASDLAYGRLLSNALDETQNRTHRLLRVSAEDVAFLRDLNVNAGTLDVFKSYAGIKDRRRLLCWQLEHQVTYDIKNLLTHMTAHRLMRYMDGQYAKLNQKDARGRYRNMQAAVSEYRDYLDMCVKLDYDMGNSFVLYPANLQEAHDRVARRLKLKADIQMHQEFQTAMQAISGHLDFEAEGMKLLLPASPDELAAEGNALHHCVGSYADRVAKKECIILFLRQCRALDKPFYTIEVRGKKVIQVRGLRNCAPTPEVDAFMARWKQQVLHACAA